MAKAATQLVKLISSGGTGVFYVKKKNTKGPKAANKLEFSKYDPVLRKHVAFREGKMK